MSNLGKVATAIAWGAFLLALAALWLRHQPMSPDASLSTFVHRSEIFVAGSALAVLAGLAAVLAGWRALRLARMQGPAGDEQADADAAATGEPPDQRASGPSAEQAVGGAKVQSAAQLEEKDDAVEPAPGYSRNTGLAGIILGGLCLAGGLVLLRVWPVPPLPDVLRGSSPLPGGVQVGSGQGLRPTTQPGMPSPGYMGLPASRYPGPPPAGYMGLPPTSQPTGWPGAMPPWGLPPVSAPGASPPGPTPGGPPPTTMPAGPMPPP